jgi:dihydrofolate reductase
MRRRIEVRTLLGYGLVDEYRPMVFPVIVGSGKQLFEDGRALELVDSKPFGRHLASEDLPSKSRARRHSEDARRSDLSYHRG